MASALSDESFTKSVELSHISSRTPPSDTATGTSTLFLHGLDSSSHTWRHIISKLETPCVAVDIRGCGRSPMGGEETFSEENVVADLKRFIDQHDLLHGGREKKRFVLVGHSMGGKIATYYAARYPEDLASLVVEDMDIQRRSPKSSPVQMNLEKVRGFEREFKSKEDAVKALTDSGYPIDRVTGWMNEGRIKPWGDDGKYWSDVNPEFRFLCYKHFCDNESSVQAWRNIASQGTATSYMFPCHLMVAGAGTICSEESVKEMQDIMGHRLDVHRFPRGTHSIHNSVQDEFLDVMEKIIRNS
eukprot:CAMPEP_0195516174 /NCGR_PEP_ID=MMETSP0794_2-20130614/6981_1 /TAXON_ID=515487 /ORGANISM="Stephanopyxis turris, Strain CCMP 815" /LENGTH=300 /DNA_ID=CAMNT_0040644701 /DNA_START=92 /DNA_END=994 /DNA_ORIENTATION=-